MSVFGRYIKCPYSVKYLFYSISASSKFEDVEKLQRSFSTNCRAYYITCNDDEELYDYFLGEESCISFYNKRKVPCTLMVYYIADLIENGPRNIPLRSLEDGFYLSANISTYGNTQDSSLGYSYAEWRSCLDCFGITDKVIEKINTTIKNRGRDCLVKFYNKYAFVDERVLIEY